MCIDYDPGATRINQENRIKLMLANAKIKAGRAKVIARPAESDTEQAPAAIK